MLTLPNELPPMASSGDEAPIFVIGTGRSGTTLLRQMLNAHPNIYIAHESGFYAYVRLSPPRTPLREWLKRYVDTFSFAWMRLDPEAVLAQCPADVDLSSAKHAYSAFLKAKAKERGKSRFGDKNPLDTQNLARLFADFPSARVIFMVRDPVPTVQSFGQMPFGTASPFVNALLCHFQVSHIQPFLDSILEVRLEDLSREPRQTMETILRFVGEPWDDAVLDHIKNAQTDDLPPSPWFVGATKRTPNQREGQAREDLSPTWVRIIEWLNRHTMERYGYKQRVCEKEPSVWQCVLTLLADIPAQLRSLFRLLSINRRMVQHLKGRKRFDPQTAQEANLMLNPQAWRHYPQIDIPEVPRDFLST